MSLTKVKKKTKEVKTELLDEIRGLADEYPTILLLRTENQRNIFLKEIRKNLKNTRLICGKNKLMQKALGTTKPSERREGLHKLGLQITGESALLFTKDPVERVLKLFKEFHPIDYARAGFVASETIRLPRGTEALSSLAHSIEPYLRKLGMPTILKEGKIQLLGEYEVCTKDKAITQDQAQVLKLLKHPIARFSMHIEGIWENGVYKPVTPANSDPSAVKAAEEAPAQAMDVEVQGA